MLGQASWLLASQSVEAYITEIGGHLGPVIFDRKGKKWQPYSVAPWAEESIDSSLPAILKVLRGDFFCLPFGGNGTPYKKEKHPVHGETANAKWKFNGIQSANGETSIHLSLDTNVRKGQVDKKIMLKDGENNIYSRHVISGMKGPMNFGHHAMIRFPDAVGSGRISTSRFVYGQVFPGAFEKPEDKGYSILKPGAAFGSLQKVPMINGETTDLTVYPSRRGFEDLVMFIHDDQLPFAWTSVVFAKEGYLWFAIKNPRILRNTIFWISNGGRHYAPWSGRHINVMGIEDVTSYFHYGIGESAQKNALSAQGFPTTVELNPKAPTTVPYIMGAAPVPAGFAQVESIEALADSSGITITSVKGKKIVVPVDLKFLEA